MLNLKNKALVERVTIYLFKLYSEKEIFDGISDKLQILFSECHSEDDVALIEHLLKEFSYLSQRQVSFALKAMAAQIIAAAAQRRCAVVATSVGEDPDSSQAIVQMIKPFLAEHPNVKIFNGIVPYVKKCDQFDICYLIDDFSGTGRTLESRLRYLKNQHISKYVNVSVGIYLVAATEKARDYLQVFTSELHIHKIIKAGISGYFTNEELKKNIMIMEVLESRLSLKYKETVLPFFGHGRAEALYAIQDMNVPNSTFPIFWWPVDCEGKRRNTCFIRAEA